VQGSSACAGGVTAFDCDDANAAIHPGATDACDDIDNNCDGRKDEGCLAGAQTTTYQYNAFNQLQSSTGPSGTTAFTYDSNGNQTSKVDPTGTTAFTWDARDRLVQVADPGGAVSRFGYDSNGLRVRMEDATGARRVLLDGVEELAEHQLGTGTRVARYDHDPSTLDALLGQSTAQGKTQAITDAIGSVYALADSANTVSRYAYDVYGARSSIASAVDTPWTFGGRRTDSGSLVYARSRYLDTSAGLFLSPDPLGLPRQSPASRPMSFAAEGPALYQYVRNAPTVATDPTGMWCAMNGPPRFSTTFNGWPKGTPIWPYPLAPGYCNYMGLFLNNFYLDLTMHSHSGSPGPGIWGPHVNYHIHEYSWTKPGYLNTPNANYHGGLFYRTDTEQVCFRSGWTGTKMGNTMRDYFCVSPWTIVVLVLGALIVSMILPEVIVAIATMELGEAATAVILAGLSYTAVGAAQSFSPCSGGGEMPGDEI
jgi:RHS repeat-associated protein